MGLKILNKKLGRNARDINYLGKDFVSFRQNLIEYAKTYFPNSYSDFNETSPGMMFIEMASYVGDVLSYYTDTALKESFIQYASDPANVFALANMLGYKAKVASPAVTELSVYQLCKADSNGNIDTKYLVTINAGMQVTSTSNSAVVFRTTEQLNFNDSTNREISVYSVNQLTSKPDYYLVKKKIRAIAATQKTQTFTFGSPEAYTSINLPETNIISIESVIDSNGNVWYGVPYLAQEMVFIDYPNIPVYDPNLSQFKDTVPYVLKLISTSYRYTTRVKSDFTTELLFGGGDTSYQNTLITPNVKNVGLGLNNSISTLNQSYDPANFLSTTTYGQAPANTQLTVNYLIGGGIESNVSSGDLVTITSINFDDDSLTTTPGVDAVAYSFAKQSIAVENEIPATGGKGRESIDEVRENALANFASQNRAVTAKDYQIRSLSMPTKYGSIAKVYAVSDNSLNANSPAGILNTQTNLDAFTALVKNIISSNQNNLNTLTSADIQTYINDFVSQNTQNAELLNPFGVNLYVLGYDVNSNYTPLNSAIKENLKTYLNEYRMLTDSINLIDGYVINIGIDFDISVYKNYSARDVLANCITELKNMFSTDNWQFNQPIYISDIELTLATVEGVASVQNLKINNLCGGNYSNISYNIQAATQNKIVYPSLDPAIFEVKFPDVDIKGRVV
jgi:hypothetical protein